jgi:hypothetical protein
VLRRRLKPLKTTLQREAQTPGRRRRPSGSGSASPASPARLAGAGPGAAAAPRRPHRPATGHRCGAASMTPASSAYSPAAAARPQCAVSRSHQKSKPATTQSQRQLKASDKPASLCHVLISKPATSRRRCVTFSTQSQRPARAAAHCAGGAAGWVGPLRPPAVRRSALVCARPTGRRNPRRRRRRVPAQ